MSLSKREDIERWEREHLAGYAAKACESRGRVFPQPEHPLRTAFQRDRDRVIHSTAFRRMEYKTQVFLPHEGDHFRTRLTHTIEVAQISRTLARSLRLNEDLSEAIALAHDLGHTPFGHAGEDVLDELLKDCGGFNHNRQSLRVVDLLEQRYAEHPGLNLSFELREGIAKHETKVRLDLSEFDPFTRPTLETSLVDIADEIAYNAHDVDDGLSAGIIRLDELRELSIWAHGAGNLFAQSGQAAMLVDDQKRYLLVRHLVNLLVTDVLEETDRQLNRLGITTLDQLRHAPERVGRYSPRIQEQVAALKQFLTVKLYRHPRLLDMTQWAREILERLFVHFIHHPDLLPPRFQEMLLTERKEVVIADYIAGMTDRYAEKIYGEVG
ncbi:MAG: deoxyguanosinetriphosphate triphosphohydrolase [Candidatus Zixiibacteriota bacterium]